MSLFPPRAVSAFADVLIAMLDDYPEQWTHDNYTLNHSSGLRIWVANGFWFCKLYDPSEVKFGWKKISLWRACRRTLKARQKQVAVEQAERAISQLRSVVSNVIQFPRDAA